MNILQPSQLRLGIIGAGRFTRLWHLRYLQRIPQVCVVGMADPIQTNIDAACFEYDLHEVHAFRTHLEMLEQLCLDAVIVASPHTLHFAHIRDVLHAGLPVLADKPLACTVHEIKQLLEIASQRELLLQVGYQRHFQPEYLFLRDYVHSGALGDLIFWNAGIGHGWLQRYEGHWRQQVELGGGGILMDTGRHIIDALLWITDLQITELRASLEHYNLACEVNALLWGIDKTRRQGHIAVLGNLPEGTWWEEVVLWGEQSGIAFENGRVTIWPKNAQPYHPPILPAASSPEENFCKSLLGQETPQTPGIVDLPVAEIVEHAYLSHKTGGIVACSL